jgi:hypothetical protein
MRAAMLMAVLLVAETGHGAVTHVAIKSGLVLKPSESYTMTVAATARVEIGWESVQTKQCATDCVIATELTGPNHFAFPAALGLTREYLPEAGKVSVEFKNISKEPVTIDIFRVKRTCEAEACKFFDKGNPGRWLVYKVGEFKSMTTSKDESYSVISGTTMSGKPFTVRAVWWDEDRNALRPSCLPFIKRYLDNHVPAEKYRPYILSGKAYGDGSNAVLAGIDTCAANAPKFGVPDSHVF